MELLEIGVSFPTVGIRNTKPKSEALLDQDYSGPGVRMLSNQRFVPYLNVLQDYVQVRLLVRSADEGGSLVLIDGKSKEASFRFAEANVSPCTPSLIVPVLVQKVGDKLPRQEMRSVARVVVYERYKVPDGVVMYEVPVMKWDHADEGM